MNDKHEMIMDFFDKANIIIKYYRENMHSEIKKENELVTIVDNEIEREFKEMVKNNFPETIVFGEETGGTLKDDTIWIIDPIDGTHNFALGNPHYAISIAYIGKNEKYGWIFAPHENFLFYSNEREFYINGKKQDRKKSPLKNPVIGTGFPYNRDKQEEEKRIISNIIDWTPELRISSSAALDLAYTAAGFLDGYFERGLHIWDVSAGYIMCKSVGLEIVNWEGNLYNIREDNIIVGSSYIVKKILDIIKI